MPCCDSPNLVTRRFVGEQKTYRYCTNCHDLPDEPAALRDLKAGAARAEEVIPMHELEGACRRS